MSRMLYLFFLCLISLPVFAHEGNFIPDEHAPIGMMGDHYHKSGEWMLSYRYMSMQMEGLRKGHQDISTQTVLNDFMMTPVEMTMDMQMVGVMRGITDDFTVMGMIPYVKKEMTMQNRMGARGTTTTEGLGDIKVSGIYVLKDGRGEGLNHRAYDRLHLNFGLGLPTGSVDERGSTLMGSNSKLGYAMQLGTGTFDPSLGITYTTFFGDWSAGAQAMYTKRVGRNNQGYTVGDMAHMTGYVARMIAPAWSLSGRLNATWWDDFEGRDDELNAMMSPGNRADLRSGKRVEALAGINYIHQEGYLAGNRLALEVGAPVYESLDGPALKQDYRFTLGWQLSF